MLSCGSPLMARIENCRKNLVANCFRNFGQKKTLNELSEMYRKIANIAKLTNSTRIASCSKTFLTNFFRNFSENLFNSNCSQKSRKGLQKSHISNKKFHCNKKHPDKYRKNNKATKRLTYKEKGIVRKFRKNRKTNKNILIFYCNNANRNRKNEKNNKFSNNSDL